MEFITLYGHISSVLEQEKLSLTFTFGCFLFHMLDISNVSIAIALDFMSVDFTLKSRTSSCM